MTATPAPTKEKIRIRLAASPEGPAGETLWAEPVDGHEGAGTYRLQNTAFHCPLLVGDLVRCEVDGGSMMQVVDVVAPAPATHVACVVVGSPERQDAATRDLSRAWERRGAYAMEWGLGMLAGAWPDGDPRQVEADLRQTLAEVGLVAFDPAGPADPPVGGAATWVRTPTSRTRDHLPEIDFDLDLVDPVPPTGSTYWVGDDPFWAERGLDHPGFLADVQAIVGIEPYLAAALEQGRHDDALAYLEALGTLRRGG